MSQVTDKPKIAAISLSWNVNFLQRKNQLGPYNEYRGIEAKVNSTVEKLLAAGFEDEIAAYTNPEWLSRAEIASKYGKRIAKIAEGIGFDIVEEKFVPRYPAGDPSHDPDKGTMIYKLKKNPDKAPKELKPKTDDEVRMIGFANAKTIQEDQPVEIRFTAYKPKRAIGKVVRVNPRSIRVKATAGLKGYEGHESTYYFKQNTANNGVFVIPEGTDMAAKLAEVEKFNNEIETREKAINDAISEFYKTHEVTMTSIGPISITEMMHPTTAESVKIKEQLNVAEENNQRFHNYLGHFVNKKLKEAGQEEL